MVQVADFPPIVLKVEQVGLQLQKIVQKLNLGFGSTVVSTLNKAVSIVVIHVADVPQYVSKVEQFEDHMVQNLRKVIGSLVAHFADIPRLF